jgi:rhodanese-related sulfurtransferase
MNIQNTFKNPTNHPTMNRFIESNKLWLSLLGLAIIIVFLAFLFRPKSVEFQTSANQALKIMNNPMIEVAVKDIGGKQLIDIRTSELFAQGHPENAINIPLRNLLDKESIALFDRLLEDSMEAVIYGSDELQATAPWLLLQQLGYQNLKLLKGGLSATNDFKESAPASTETSILDISSIQSKPESLDASGAKSDKKKPESIIPLRKQASSGGGC